VLSICYEILNLSNCKISRHYIAKIERHIEEFLDNGLDPIILCKYIEKVCKNPHIYTYQHESEKGAEYRACFKIKEDFYLEINYTVKGDDVFIITIIRESNLRKIVNRCGRYYE